MDRVISKSAEAAAIISLLDMVLRMNKPKKTVKDSIGGNKMKALKKKAALDRALNRKLYKLGRAYGKSLRKIYGMDAPGAYAWGLPKPETYAYGVNSPRASIMPGDINQAISKFISGEKAARTMPSLPATNAFSLSGAANKALEQGGQYAANFGSTIGGLAGKVSPKAAELFAKYPKTTGLAAAAAIAAALGGVGYGAYKMYQNGKKKKR